MRAPGQVCQRVVLCAFAGGVEQAGHVHSVPSKALAVDAHVGQHMAIEAVVVPDLFDASVLEEGSEGLQDGLSFLLCLDSVLSRLLSFKKRLISWQSTTPFSLVCMS